ncbi:hypothetical protein DFH27DRAFT_523294 [Peziza echinospora]|nr:hypothetical protein DFH27DRAFT_523294 [Peziza echinospora]
MTAAAVLTHICAAVCAALRRPEASLTALLPPTSPVCSVLCGCLSSLARPLRRPATQSLLPYRRSHHRHRHHHPRPRHFTGLHTTATSAHKPGLQLQEQKHRGAATPPSPADSPIPERLLAHLRSSNQNKQPSLDRAGRCHYSLTVTTSDPHNYRQQHYLHHQQYYQQQQDMFQPTIPETLPSYPPSSQFTSSSGGGGRRFLFGARGNGGTTNKIHHLPPPPSPSQINNGGYYGGGANNYPTSPAAHLYSTPPTSRKKIHSFNRRRLAYGEDDDEEDDVSRGGISASPPPLSTFYDGPLDGSLTLPYEEEDDDDVVGRVVGGVSEGLSNCRRDGGFVGKSRKRSYTSTLDDDEYYENGRGPMVRMGANGAGRGGVIGGGGGQGAGGAVGGGGKRRIIDVVGSVASKLWEVVKGTSSWSFYYPGSILGGAPANTANAAGMLAPRGEVEMVNGNGCGGGAKPIGEVYLGTTRDGTSMRRESTWGGPSSSTPTLGLHQPASSSSTSLVTEKASVRRPSITTPSSPTKTRRKSSAASNGSFGRPQKHHQQQQQQQQQPAQLAPTDFDTNSGLRASWVLVSPETDKHSTTSNTAARSRPTNIRQISARPLLRPLGHARTSSSSVAAITATGKRRPFRYAAKPITPTANVSFDFNTSPTAAGGVSSNNSTAKSSGGRRTSSGRKSISGAQWVSTGFEVVGLGATAAVGLGEDEDEVDESMRRFNEQLKAMIREGKEALGSTVEVVYEDY